jgi:hypothetical protein
MVLVGCSITILMLQNLKLNLHAIKNFNAEDFIDRKKLEKWTDMLNMPWFSEEA